MEKEELNMWGCPLPSEARYELRLYENGKPSVLQSFDAADLYASAGLFLSLLDGSHLCHERMCIVRVKYSGRTKRAEKTVADVKFDRRTRTGEAGRAVFYYPLHWLNLT